MTVSSFAEAKKKRETEQRIVAAVAWLELHKQYTKVVFLNGMEQWAVCYQEDHTYRATFVEAIEWARTQQEALHVGLQARE